MRAVFLAVTLLIAGAVACGDETGAPITPNNAVAGSAGEFRALAEVKGGNIFLPEGYWTIGGHKYYTRIEVPPGLRADMLNSDTVRVRSNIVGLEQDGPLVYYWGGVTISGRNLTSAFTLPLVWKGLTYNHRSIYKDGHFYFGSVIGSKFDIIFSPNHIVYIEVLWE